MINQCDVLEGAVDWGNIFLVRQMEGLKMRECNFSNSLRCFSSGRDYRTVREVPVFLLLLLLLLPPLLSVRADPYVRHYIHYLLDSSDLSALLYSISALDSAPKCEWGCLLEASRGEAGGVHLLAPCASALGILCATSLLTRPWVYGRWPWLKWWRLHSIASLSLHFSVPPLHWPDPGWWKVACELQRSVNSQNIELILTFPRKKTCSLMVTVQTGSYCPSKLAQPMFYFLMIQKRAFRISQ